MNFYFLEALCKPWMASAEPVGLLCSINKTSLGGKLLLSTILSLAMD